MDNCLKSNNPVSAPKHYIGDGHIECKDAMRSMLAGYDRADAKSAVYRFRGGGIDR